MSTERNRALAAMFSEMAELLALAGENQFRIRSYQNLAHIFSNLDRDVADLLASGELAQIQGVGKGTLAKAAEFLETGRLQALDELRSRFPAGLLEMMRIPGFGPKRARAVHDGLGITSIHELEEAAGAGKLETLDGFGKKMAENIAAGIEFIKRTRDRFLWSDAWQIVSPVAEALRHDEATVRIEIAGSLRRRKETVKDADMLAASTRPARTADAFIAACKHQRISARGQTKVSVVTELGMSADLRIVTDVEFPYALHHFTGSKEHNIAMRTRAQKRRFKMNEYGLFKESKRGEKLVKCKDEHDIFKALGLDYIPPELREDMGEIDAAENQRLPALVEPTDLKGAVHCHTSWSDGHDGIEEMAGAASALGFQYIVICDHSRSAAYAGGLGADELDRQRREIERLNEQQPDFRVFSGIECDILADGSLDLPDAALDALDVVVASVHSRFNLSAAEQTRRIIRVLEQPHVHVLGHPSGRLLLQRDGYPLDMEAVLAACARTGTAVEINGNPNRLDLDWRWVKRAGELGIPIICACDAHGAAGISDTLLAVGVARKGWLTREQVLNTLSAERFRAALKKKG